MRNNHQPPCPLNNLHAPPKSNRRPWAIFDPLACVMIFMLLGCAGSSRSDYTTNSTSPPATSANSSTASSNSNSNRASSRTDAPTSQSGGMAGTWSGSLQCSNGRSLESIFKVSSSGNPIYEYQSKSGAREAELTSSGQKVQYVPPGGGVVTLVVNSLSTSSDHISFALRITEERTTGETLDQNEASLTADARLSGAELEVEMNVRSQGVASQPSFVVPDKESAGTCRGKLQKR
jgi:hypothetical protein